MNVDQLLFPLREIIDRHNAQTIQRITKQINELTAKKVELLSETSELSRFNPVAHMLDGLDCAEIALNTSKIASNDVSMKTIDDAVHILAKQRKEQILPLNQLLASTRNLTFSLLTSKDFIIKSLENGQPPFPQEIITYKANSQSLRSVLKKIAGMIGNVSEIDTILEELNNIDSPRDMEELIA